MVVCEIGGRSLTKNAFKHVLETEVEKLVKFFGEENRSRIKEKVYKTNYIIANRKKIDSQKKALDTVADYLKGIGAEFSTDLLRIRNEDATIKFISKFKEWALSNPNVKDDLEFRAFWASYFEKQDSQHIKTVQGKQEHYMEMRSKFNNPEFIENLQKRVDSIQSFQILKNAFYEWRFNKQVYYEYYKKGLVSEYNEQLKWYLNNKQIVCRQALAKVFGEERLLNIAVESKLDDISKMFINYISQNPELRSFDDKIDYGFMFDELTGENLTLQEYEDKYEKQIKQLSETLHKKFEKMDKEKNAELINSSVPELKKILKKQGVKDVDDIISRFMIYLRILDNSAAYATMIETENENFKLIALPKDFEFCITHETLHSISSDEDIKLTGFDTKNAEASTTSLNEVITEFFALKIDDRKAENLNSNLYCSYSAAFPIMQKFLNQNLNKIKVFYLNRDVDALKNLVGEENFEQLCQNLTELLNLSKMIPYATLRVKQILKDPSLYKNEKLLETINKLSATMESIEKYIALNNGDDAREI